MASLPRTRGAADWHTWRQAPETRGAYHADPGVLVFLVYLNARPTDPRNIRVLGWNGTVVPSASCAGML